MEKIYVAADVQPKRMPTQLDSTRTEVTTGRRGHPAVPALSFVVLVAVVNGALNGVLAGVRSVLPPALQSEFAVTVPLSPLGAGLVSVGAGLLAVGALALFVRAVGETDSTERGPPSVTETVRRFARATAVAVGGVLAFALGLALFVVPGLVVLVYLPFVFVAVVLDGRTVAGAIEASHDRIVSRPAPVAATALGTALALVAVGLAGVASTVLPPAAEFVVGTVCSALVVLFGMYLLTGLYGRLPRQQSRSSSASAGAL